MRRLVGHRRAAARLLLLYLALFACRPGPAAQPRHAAPDACAQNSPRPKRRGRPNSSSSPDRTRSFLHCCAVIGRDAAAALRQWRRRFGSWARLPVRPLETAAAAGRHPLYADGIAAICGGARRGPHGAGCGASCCAAIAACCWRSGPRAGSPRSSPARWPNAVGRHGGECRPGASPGAGRPAFGETDAEGMASATVWRQLQPNRGFLASLHRPDPRRGLIAGGYGTREVAGFLDWARAHGVRVIGGWPTEFADAPPDPALGPTLAAIYARHGAAFLDLPNQGRYPRGRFLRQPGPSRDGMPDAAFHRSSPRAGAAARPPPDAAARRARGSLPPAAPDESPPSHDTCPAHVGSSRGAERVAACGGDGPGASTRAGRRRLRQDRDAGAPRHRPHSARGRSGRSGCSASPSPIARRPRCGRAWRPSSAPGRRTGSAPSMPAWRGC